MKNFIKKIQFVFMPNYWFMNELFSKEVDRFMCELLDKHDFTNIGSCTAMLGGVEIWIANKPYSCMCPYSSGISCRPSRQTIRRGLEKLEADILKELLENAQA